MGGETEGGSQNNQGRCGCILEGSSLTDLGISVYAFVADNVTHESNAHRKRKSANHTWGFAACVDRPVTKNEWRRSTQGVAAYKSDWSNLSDRAVWDVHSAGEYCDVVAESRRLNET